MFVLCPTGHPAAKQAEGIRYNQRLIKKSKPKLMRKIIALASLGVLSLTAFAQVGPEITSWVRNTNNATGYNNIPSNCQLVQYSTSNVYVSCTCIPGYDIGPWTGNPNVASNQNFVYKITRNPQHNTGTPTAIGLGHIGVWTNGVSIFNADDAQTYNNQGVWHRNAYFFEGQGFDSCLGHPQQNGEYHHHVSPNCLYDNADSTHHSPIIGYAFDGFPVYGAYAYTNTNGTGPIKRMRPSYQKRVMTDRTTLPGGGPAASAGPAISATYPIGAFIQDYEYVAGSGDLDSANGRFCITPEYPSGTYAYFVTIDSTLTPVYPYTLGLYYYGTVQPGNTGPGGGHVTIGETTTVYNGPTAVNELNKSIKFDVYPNPVKDYAYIYFDPSSANNITGTVFDQQGRIVKLVENMQPSISYTLDFSTLPAGIYTLQLLCDKDKVVQKIVVTK